MSSSSASVEQRLRGLSASKARLLELLIAQQSSSRLPLIKPYPRMADESGILRFPASCAQQRLWFIDQLEEGSAAYNVPVALRLRGHLCVESLRRAFDVLISRHEVLRTVFLNIGGESMQEIRPTGQFELTVCELGGGARHEAEQQLLAHRVEEGRRRFQLQQGPLIRARLLRMQVDEHVLLITMHHIVSDGWSLGVMLSELAELYSALHERRADSLIPLPVQYGDYAQWQREWLRGAALEKQLSYWRANLERLPPQLDLPLDRPRPAVQAYRGQNVAIAMTRELSAALHALARQRGMTLYMILYAAWAILLSRLAGQSDVVIGTPIANRRRRELEGLIGFFVNTLAMRVQVEPHESLAEFLDRVKAATLAAYEHQDVPFEQLVEVLRPERALNRHPIFQVIFVWQNAPPGSMKFSGLRVSVEEEINSTSKFDLVLMLEERGDCIAGLLNYDIDLFDRSTVQRWLDSFVVLLQAMSANEHARIGELPLLSTGEAAQLERFNATAAEYAASRCIHGLFEEQAALTPDATALTHGRESISYAELNARADSLAALLKSKGVLRDQAVGLCVERSTDMIVGLLAILKAGGAYLPLDPHYPPERLKYMVDDGAPNVILTQGWLAEALPATQAEALCLDAVSRDQIVDPAMSRADTRSGTALHGLLYVIYTSGSTGKPKGIAMPHAAMLNLVEWHRECMPLRTGQRVLQFAALSFDVAFQEIFSTLCLGGTLVLVDEDVRRDVRALTALLIDERVERLFVPPLMLQGLAEHFHTGGELPRHLTDVITAGEQLRVSSDIVELFKALPRCRLHNHYGPTETHVVTALTLGGDPADWPELPSIGCPIANTQIHVLDEVRRPVPIGVVGEIYIGGANVARGYLRREELTAERFVLDPFAAASDARMYRTGDLGRWRANGTLEYLGRNDDQVKIRGFRIELGEIEAQLARHPLVKEVAVVAREDAPGEKRLVAYFIPRDQASPSTDELRAHLRKALPEYMVPNAIVPLDDFPLTPSGKLNRRALPVPDLRSFATLHYEAPANETEKVMAEIWQRLLGIDRVGRDDSFFDLGGHSLLVLKVLFEINRSLGKALKVSDVYQCATIRDLAIRMSGATAGQELLDLSGEATFDASVIVPSGSLRRPACGILLTGATGFVGRFLLAQLLRETDASIYCLVRARSSLDAQYRLTAMLKRWDLWCEEFERRIVAVPGDLRQPALGIDARSWRDLCGNVDSIFHCGTSMNHLEPYAMAKVANVGSVNQLLQLATSGRPKLFNYLSTLGIFTPPPAGTKRVVDESSVIDRERHCAAQGYVASKWVGEKISMLAMERGIPCNVFRLGLVWADSQQGRYDELQRVYRVFKSSLLTGIGIQHYEQYEMPPVPVDYVARALTFLAGRYPEGHGVFHICSSIDRSSGWFESCNDGRHVSLELVPFYEWTGLVRRAHESGMSLPIVPLIAGMFDMDELTFYEHLRAFRAGLIIEARQTNEELARGGIVWPAPNGELITACLTTMLSRDPDLQAFTDRGCLPLFMPTVSANSQFQRVPPC